MGANESNALGALRTVSAAQTAFRSQDTSRTYANALSVLSGTTPQYIDDVLGAGEKHGYKFAIAGATKYVWSCTATPASVGKTGNRTFCVDESGVLYEGTCAAGTPIE